MLVAECLKKLKEKKRSGIINNSKQNDEKWLKNKEARSTCTQSKP